jgi:hypothetical protein
LTAAGGVRPYKLAGVQKHRFAPGGSFGISSKFAPNQSFSASYERAVEQAFGFDQPHLAHRVNTSYQFTMGSRLNLNGTASYGVNSYPLMQTFKQDGRTATLGLQYLLWRKLSLGAGYGIWIRHQSSAPSAATYRTTFSLTYGGSWR